MTRVLLVHHDIDLADNEADALRSRGYTVQQCMGPIGASCPILSGRVCDMAEKADVLVYDAPVVLTATGMEPSWIELAGLHGVTPLVGAPTGQRLAEAIEEALGTDAPA